MTEQSMANPVTTAQAAPKSREPHPADYRPHHETKAFHEGYHAYCKGDWPNSPYPTDSVEAQAFDRGADYAMRLNRWNAKGC